MGRDIKRVPRDFAWPLEERWVGYVGRVVCPQCNACGDVGACTRCYGEMQERTKVDPPTGDGWQLWETTSEGSPLSPVFATLDELCAWCARNASFFGTTSRGTKEEWRKFAEGWGFTEDCATGKREWTPPGELPRRWRKREVRDADR